VWASDYHDLERPSLRLATGPEEVGGQSEPEGLWPIVDRYDTQDQLFTCIDAFRPFILLFLHSKVCGKLRVNRSNRMHLYGTRQAIRDIWKLHTFLGDRIDRCFRWLARPEIASNTVLEGVVYG